MRTKEEVQAEIDWREKEKEKEDLVKLIDLNDPDKDYYLSRITNLSFAIEWCKWFLNEST